MLAALAAVAATALCAATGQASAPEVTRLVTFGHSWVEGRYPDPLVVPWPERVAAAHGLELDNRAAGGTESPEIARAVAAYEFTPQDEVVIATMLNDVRARGAAGLKRYRRHVRLMLDHLAGAAGSPSRIVLLVDAPIALWRGNPSLFAGYDQGSNRALAAYARALRTLASRSEYRALNLRVVDLRRRWDVSVDIGPDGVHPAETGTKRIARIVRRALDAMSLTRPRAAERWSALG